MMKTVVIMDLAGVILGAVAWCFWYAGNDSAAYYTLFACIIVRQERSFAGNAANLRVLEKKIQNMLVALK